MATTEKFNLKWNDFASSISGSFREIKEEREFQDVTLACQEDKIGAHRVVLAACSPTLRELLRGNQHHHPLLYLRGIKFSDLQSLLTFMYHGEVNIAQQELDSFLSVAEELKIRGLTQTSSSSQSESRTDNSDRTKRKSVTTARPAEEEEEIQEIVSIKTEPPVSAGSLDQYKPEEEMDYVYPDQDYENTVQSDFSTVTTEYQQEKSAGLNTQLERHSILTQHLVKEVTDGHTVYKCQICGHSAGYTSRTTIINHIESRHFPDLFTYACEVCGEEKKTKKSLQRHIERYHKINSPHYIVPS